ncbi:MAG: SLC13 family permease [Candidatus Lokiarchaeota archaeon]
MEYIGLKIIHVTKGNNRVFFYIICIFTSFMVAFIEDLSLSLIMVPLIYRTCRVLKIPAGTYLMGMTITINIGAILTPISSLKNFIVSKQFGWGFGEYLGNMGILFIITLLITVISLDYFVLRKEEKPTERNKELLLKTRYFDDIYHNYIHFCFYDNRIRASPCFDNISCNFTSCTF